MKTHKNLDVWQNSVEFVTEIYMLTNAFPENEKFGLTNQIRRSAVSIPSNIAEGAGRHSKKEFSRFLNIAQGSATELETQLIISKNLDFIDYEQYENVVEKLTSIMKMLSGLVRSLKNNQSQTTNHK
jgi:four helix bundle protein